MSFLKRLKPKHLTTHEFMRRVQQAIIRMKTVQEKEEQHIEDLTAIMIRDHSPRQAGDLIAISDHPDGWVSFTIERVFPDIDWKENKLRWKYFGVFSGQQTKESSIQDEDLDKLTLTTEGVAG